MHHSERVKKIEGKNLPNQERYRFIVRALEDFFFLPALDSFHPFLARTSPILRDERHFLYFPVRDRPADVSYRYE